MMKNRWKILLAALPVAGMIAAVVVLYGSPAAASHCSGVQITGGDLDAVVNADPSTRATTFCVHAGTYTISEPLTLKNGDKLIGEEGTFSYLPLGKDAAYGSATDPDPVVKVVAGSGVGVVIRGFGSNIEVAWIDISGAKTTSGCTGTGVGIAAGSTDGTFRAHHNHIHDNYSVGIGNAHGSITHNEFASNTRNSNCIGNNGAGVKGGTEYEAAFNYVHDEQGNGLWCDRGCDDDPTSGLGGFWAHHNVVVNNAHGGIRIENSPNAALIEFNEVHGNSYGAVRGGVSIRDSQDALVQSNVFGGNRDRVAVRASDSGRTDRTDLWNVDIVNNTLNGETIKGCELPDNVVYCSGNQ